MSPAEYKQTRKQLGLTQAELASLLGVPREAIIRRESGKQKITEEMVIALQTLPSSNAEIGQSDEQPTK